MIQHAQYITNGQGQREFVVLPVRAYQDMLEQLSDIQLYDEAKQVQEPAMPMEEAFKLVEEHRRNHL